MEVALLLNFFIICASRPFKGHGISQKKVSYRRAHDMMHHQKEEEEAEVQLTLTKKRTNEVRTQKNALLH